MSSVTCFICRRRHGCTLGAEDCKSRDLHRLLHLYVHYLYMELPQGNYSKRKLWTQTVFTQHKSQWVRRFLTKYFQKFPRFYRNIPSKTVSCYFYRQVTIKFIGRGSSVGIATGYGLDGLGIESRWRRDIPHLSSPALGPPSLLYSGYPVFPGDKERSGRDTDSSPPSSTVVMEG